MSTTVSSTSKVAYMYDQQTDKWYAVAGVANEGHTYNWSAPHTFGSNITVNDVIRAKGGVNRFQNPTDRDTIIPSPLKGIVCFVEQTDGGTDINQVQIYNGTSWIGMLDTATLSTNTSDITLGLGDAGTTIVVDSSIDRNVIVPPNSTAPFAVGQRLDIIRYNTGNVTIVEGSGVTVHSKNSNKKIAARYSGATLIKTATDTWILIGDLTA